MPVYGFSVNKKIQIPYYATMIIRRNILPKTMIIPLRIKFIFLISNINLDIIFYEIV